MKSKKELLRMKKKILIYTLTAIIGTTTITGCKDKFTYEYTNDGIITVDGKISYDTLKKLKLIHLINKNVELDKYLLVQKKKDHMYRSNIYYYQDIETGRIIYHEKDELFQNFELEIIVDNMVDYLIKYNIVKEDYTIKDIQNLKQTLLMDETLNFSTKLKKLKQENSL